MWIEVTGGGGARVLVNFSQVTHMSASGSNTKIYFVGGGDMVTLDSLQTIRAKLQV